MEPRRRGTPLPLSRARLAAIVVTIVAATAALAVALRPAPYVYRVPDQLDDGWSVASLDEVGIRAGAMEGVVRQIRSRRYPNIHSLLLVKSGLLVLETYSAGWDSDRKHEVQSASKSFRSALIGIAIDKGLIADVATPVSAFYPEHAALFEGGKNEITLEHILTMTSGIDWTERAVPYADPRNTLRQMYEGRTDWVTFVLARPLSGTPGRAFRYNTGASLLLSSILSSAAGVDATRFADEYLYRHMQMQEHGGHNPPLADGVRPRDMAKLGLLFLNKGVYQGQRVLSEKWIEASTQPRIRSDLPPGGWLSWYGYQWWVGTEEVAGQQVSMYAAWGNGGQVIAVFPQLDLVAVFTGACFDDAARPFEVLRRALIPAVIGP